MGAGSFARPGGETSDHLTSKCVLLAQGMYPMSLAADTKVAKRTRGFGSVNEIHDSA